MLHTRFALSGEGYGRERFTSESLADHQDKGTEACAHPASDNSLKGILGKD